MNESKITLLDNCDMVISEKDLRLLKLLREVDYGQITIFVQDGVPLRVEQGIKSTKL